MRPAHAPHSIWLQHDITGTGAAMLDFGTKYLRYTKGDIGSGVQVIEFPDEPMTDDELIAWATVMYKMGD